MVIASRFSVLEKWIILGSIIGLVSGLFASFFYAMLESTTALFAQLLGVDPGNIAGTDLGMTIVSNYESIEIMLLVPSLVMGAIASSVLVYKFAPEAEGHGTDAAIAAYHRLAGMLRARVPLVKAVASSFTIGSGGSGGIEGPSALMGAGMGSIIAQVLRLDLWDRRIALVAGISGALSALFRAPIGTAIFAVEVLFKRDIAADALIPALVASVVGYAATLPFWGFSEVFPSIEVDPRSLYTMDALASYIILSFVLAFFAIMYVNMFYGVNKLLQRHIKHALARPVVGATLAGAVGLAVPHALGSGREVLVSLLEKPDDVLAAMPVDPHVSLPLVIILLALAKMAATSFSIGSGGSGGVFMPSILAGALIGYSYGLAVEAYTPIDDPLVYAYLGMAGFFAAVSKAPLATSIMIAEMSNDYAFLIPALLISYVARELSGGITIYKSQIPRRVRPELVNMEAVLTMLRARGIRVRVRAIEIAEKTFIPLRASYPVSKAIDLISRLRQHIIPVIDEKDRVLGAIDASYLEKLLSLNPDAPIAKLPLRTPPVVFEDEDLVHVMFVMEESEEDTYYVIVVDKEFKYRGIILYQDLASAIVSSYVHNISGASEKTASS
jgi:CIC family chloride channel protein